MKTLVLILVLMWSGQMAWAATEYRVGVDGLACPFCAYGIEKQLNKLGGIVEMKVDVAAGVIVVTMKGSATLTEDDVRSAVEKAGFSLRRFDKGSPGD